jgi:hypothetical protein
MNLSFMVFTRGLEREIQTDGAQMSNKIRIVAHAVFNRNAPRR